VRYVDSAEWPPMLQVKNVAPNQLWNPTGADNPK
jgi:hypothetical protein